MPGVPRHHMVFLIWYLNVKWMKINGVYKININYLFVQVVEDGYEFFAKRQLVTLFSAPNYCGEFDNAGGMMSVDETLMCSFQVRSYMYNINHVIFIFIIIWLNKYIFNSNRYWSHLRKKRSTNTMVSTAEDQLRLKDHLPRRNNWHLEFSVLHSEKDATNNLMYQYSYYVSCGHWTKPNSMLCIVKFFYQLLLVPSYF